MSADRIRFPIWVILWIAMRDGWRCHICGLGHLADDPWEIDHDIPIAKTDSSLSGRHPFKNLRLAHQSCNREKADA